MASRLTLRHCFHACSRARKSTSPIIRWAAWSAELLAYRTRLARLLAAPRYDCVVPRTSAGQGLRAILNSYDSVPRVVATRGEFDSIDLILRHYAQRGRIALSLVEPRTDGLFAAEDLR